MRYSNQVKEVIADIQAKAPISDFSNINVVINNLAMMHQIITATERLLKDAAEESIGDLRDYYIEHLQEETGHAEWLGRDLESVGVRIAEVGLTRECVAMAGSQYYLMKHVHPASLLGYMAVLEGNPVSLEFIEKAEDIHGKELFKTLRYHAEHDLEHREALYEIIDKVAHPSIINSACNAAYYLNEISTILYELNKVTL